MRLTALAACFVLSLTGGALAEAPLADALQAGDMDRARALLEAADVNATQADGATALHWAAYRGGAELAGALIARGAAANVMNAYGSTPLAEAASNGDAAMVMLLLDAGAHPESANAEGQTALMLAARSGNVRAAQALLAHGAAIDVREGWRGQTALMWAAAQGQADMVRFLAAEGSDLDARSTINDWARQVTSEPRALYRLTGGLTPLLYAAREGCLACVQALVEAGAEIDLPDPDRITPLMMAIDNLHFDIARYLLEQGANADTWDWWGRSPLYLAVDLNGVPHGGRADLPSTDTTRAIELVRMLLADGANPNVQLKLLQRFRAPSFDRGGDVVLNIGATPLLRAAKSFDTESVQLLLAYGALVDLPNVQGVTPLMAAAGLGTSTRDTRGNYDLSNTEERSIATLRLLLDAGADINAKVTDVDSLTARITRSSTMSNREGQTALYGAANWGWTEVARFLIDQGAATEMVDRTGKTPRDAAAGHEDTAALFESVESAPAPQPIQTSAAE